MEMADVDFQIDLIIKKEKSDTRINPTWNFKHDDNGKLIFVYDHANTLIDVYSNIQNDPKLKDIFLKFLINDISYTEEHIWEYHTGFDNEKLHSSGSVALCFYTLLKLGLINKLKDSLRIRTYTSGTLILLLRELGNEEYSYFDKELITILLDKISKWKANSNFYGDTSVALFEGIKHIVNTRILNYTYTNIKKETKGVNLEINQDKKTLQEKISYLKFNKKCAEYLDEIDKFLYSENKVVNAGIVGTLRNFMHDIFIDLAKKVEENRKEKMPHVENRSPIGDSRAYLKDKLNLSDNENKIIDNFMNILHGEGGHAFMTEKEYFRLARNMVIEIMLFVISLYEKI